MYDTTRTTTVLLEGLCDEANAEAWMTFDARYRPILTGFALRLGLTDADAEDVAAETITQFLIEYRQGKYDRSRGRLRSWLVGIARYRVAGIRRAAARRRVSRGESAIINLDDDADLDRVWELERRRVILLESLEALRKQTKLSDKTIRAFEMLALNEMPVAAVAEALSTPVHDVYLAKSRVAEKLRDILAQVTQLFDAEE